MSADTRALNRSSALGRHDPTWVFAYGSLIFKVDFPYRQRRRASVRHWERRLWQGSHDHRGTPESPGRVATLVARRGARCDGVAYLVEPEVFDHLDEREKNGYLRVGLSLCLDGGQGVPGVVYIADPANAAFLGAAPEREIACQIAAARGPSGPNSEYLLGLAQALRDLCTHDHHVFEIESHLLGQLVAQVGG